MSFWQEYIKIGNLSVPRFMSGPLDGITDSPFRQLVRKFSPHELLYTEMRHVRCISTPKGGALALKFEQMERPINFQIAASSEDYIPMACEKILAAGVDAIDLNAGCPANNVVGSCCGSALMANPEKLEKILLALNKAVPNIPVTLKIRAGFTHKNALEIAKLAQDCGVAALAIHPRLKTQKFSGIPDYPLAGEVKKALSIPVLLSGNIVNFATAKRAYEITGVDGFLIGRGMWAKPWKLLEIQKHSQNEEFNVTSEMILQVALQHLHLMVQHYGIRGLYCFRKHLPFYIKGGAGALKVREYLVRSESVDEVKQGLIHFLTQE